MMDNQIKAALRGDKQAQADCTAEGVLLPCPFCVGEAELHTTYDKEWVECKRCGAKTQKEVGDYYDESFMDGSYVIPMWNTRASTVVHGRWICNPDVEKVSLVCSVCGQIMPFVPEYLPEEPPFCNCGAKMDGGLKDGKVD